MKNLWNWVKNNPNRAMFLLPILLVAGISISHVVSWYDMANPINWAIYLSIAIEVGAITALVAATNKIKGGIWFMFGLVTFIQMVGNIFYSYKEIDETGELFKSWIELTGPVWELMGTETTDLIGMKRWLAFLEGGLLPIISLTSLHFFVKYEKPKKTEDETTNHPTDKVPNKETPPVIDRQEELEKQIKDEMSKIINEKIGKEVRMSEIQKESNPQHLVEEEKVEDEVVLPIPEIDDDSKEEVLDEPISEIIKKVDEEVLDEIKKVKPEDLQESLKNRGHELKRKWYNIINKAKGNRLGE